jgi:MFS family permease
MIAARRSPFRVDGLDTLNFFVANLQTGFGPFIAVYLTTHAWTQADIGIVLSVATAASILGQVPGGALVDAMPVKRVAAAIGLALIGVSAVLLALWPDRFPVTIAECLHSLAACMLIPAIATIAINRVALNRVAERLGRNARYAALGSAIGAAVMGAFGTWISPRAVFWLAAFLCVPALAALWALPPPAAQTVLASGGGSRPKPGFGILADRRLLAFAGCSILFQLANAAMLPLAAVELTGSAGEFANLVVAACLVVPQFIVAALSPFVGRAAERWGRQRVLLIGFLALPARALLFALFPNPVLIVMSQALDGIGGAVYGVCLPLICSDIARGTNRFNLSVGAIGLCGSIGATMSTALAGAIGSADSTRTAFFALAAAGVAAVAVVALVMPETRPTRSAPPSPAA